MLFALLMLTLSSVVGLAGGGPAKARSLSIDQPRPPHRYSLPSKAIKISGAKALSKKLAAHSHTNLILSDGVYDAATPFHDANGDHIYAAHLGGVIFHTGLVLGGNFASGGALVQGIVFQVSSAKKTAEGAVIQTWGPAGRDAQILDTTINGQHVANSGIAALQPDGLVVKRVVLKNFTSYGLLEDENRQGVSLARPASLQDIQVSHVSRPVPGSSNGTAEACIWLGNTATLRRARVGHCALDGVWTGTAFHNGLVTEVTSFDTPVGFYLEHFTTNARFTDLHAGPHVKTGVNCEWADPVWGGEPACVGDRISHSVFDTTSVGVYLDQGTTSTNVSNSTFIGQQRAGIVDYKGRSNSYRGNHFKWLGPGASNVSKS